MEECRTDENAAGHGRTPANLALPLVPQEGRRRHRQGHWRLEGSPSHRPADDPEPTSRRLRRSLGIFHGHQGIEGAPSRQEEGEEHQAQRKRGV